VVYISLLKLVVQNLSISGIALAVKKPVSLFGEYSAVTFTAPPEGSTRKTVECWPKTTESSARYCHISDTTAVLPLTSFTSGV